MNFLRKLFSKGGKSIAENNDKGITKPENPSYFYKCPHCNHILLKNSMMMNFAGMGTGIANVGGGCPDCGGALDAEAVYNKREYDITISEIARGNYSKDVINNILASHKSGKIKLTSEELKLLKK